VEKKGGFGKESDSWKEEQHTRMKESVHKESNNWKEEQQTCMGGIPNDGRIRVLAMYCKWMKSPKCINIDIEVCWAPTTPPKFFTKFKGAPVRILIIIMSYRINLFK
jgi:hypothetical protein